MTTKPKLLKGVQNLGSKVTNQQMASFPEVRNNSHLVAFSILLRSITRILQSDRIIWEKDHYQVDNSFTSGPVWVVAMWGTLHVPKQRGYCEPLGNVNLLGARTEMSTLFVEAPKHCTDRNVDSLSICWGTKALHQNCLLQQCNSSLLPLLPCCSPVIYFPQFWQFFIPTFRQMKYLSSDNPVFSLTLKEK